MFVRVLVCLNAYSGESWFNFPQDLRRKIFLVMERAAQNTEHIMLLYLWRQINFCVVGHNKAGRHLMCRDHVAENPAGNMSR